jgi:hypothetical protein
MTAVSPSNRSSIYEFGLNEPPKTSGHPPTSQTHEFVESLKHGRSMSLWVIVFA